MTTWDRIVMKAWLARSRGGNDASRRHPPKADRIYKRYAKNIQRAEAYLTAENMVERYKNWRYTAWQRATDHTKMYSPSDWQYQYWMDVAENILRIQKGA